MGARTPDVLRSHRVVGRLVQGSSRGGGLGTVFPFLGAHCLSPSLLHPWLPQRGKLWAAVLCSSPPSCLGTESCLLLPEGWALKTRKLELTLSSSAILLCSPSRGNAYRLSQRTQWGKDKAVQEMQSWFRKFILPTSQDSFEGWLHASIWHSVGLRWISSYHMLFSLLVCVGRCPMGRFQSFMGQEIWLLDFPMTPRKPQGFSLGGPSLGQRQHEKRTLMPI